jgi:hypothetical protein
MAGSKAEPMMCATEALYRRPNKQVGEGEILGPERVDQTLDRR